VAHLPGHYKSQSPIYQSYNNSHTANPSSANPSQYTQPYSSYTVPQNANTLPAPVPFIIQSHQFGTAPQSQLPNAVSLPHPLHGASNQGYPGEWYF
jgi:hypothetical protein